MFSQQYILQTLKNTLAANPTGEKLIRVYITAGDGFGLCIHGTPRLIILVDDFTPPSPLQLTRGVSLMTYCYSRPTPLAKSTNYTEGVLATIIAKKKKHDEAVFVNHKNELIEGTTYNIIAQTSSGWVTPKEGLLPGITLQTVMRLLSKMKCKIHYRNIKLSELKNLEGLFITSSNREILPVRRVDNIAINVSAASQNAPPILEQFRRYVERYTAANKKFWE
jgi:branched-chain amino acid aminotransferase